MLNRAAHIAQILSLIPGAYCAYAAWVTLHPQQPSLVPGDAVAPINSTILLISFGAFVALLALGGILGIVSWKQGHKSAVTDTPEFLDTDKRGIGKAALLFEYADVANQLAMKLEDVWHQWDAAGEKLVYPLRGKIELKNWSSDSAILLRNELFQFGVLYRYHLDMLRNRFPEFISNITRGGFPSDEEYPAVRRNLLSHAEALRARAALLWEAQHASASGAL